MTARGTRANPNFINCNPLNIMQKLYEIKARQDGSNMKVIVREITLEEVRAGGYPPKAKGSLLDGRKERNHAGLQL